MQAADARTVARAASVATLWRSLADHWLPRDCALCGGRLGLHERGLCAPCLASLPGGTAVRCPCCGLATGRGMHARADAPGIGDALDGHDGHDGHDDHGDSARHGGQAPGGLAACAACTAAPPAFDHSIVLADYAPPLDALVRALKFRGEFALGAALGAALARCLARQLAGGALPPVQALVPMPLAPLRLAGRGYNQSAAIAHGVARALRLPVQARLLWRCRETPAQSTLALADRQANVAAALRAHPAVAGRCLVVVDDVMTSGATLQAAAAALKSAGARCVINLVAARTP